MTNQAGKVHRILNTEPVLHRVECGIADLMIPDQFLGITHQDLFVAGKALRSGALGDRLDGLFRYARFPGQAGVGGEFILGGNLPGRGNNHQFLKSFRYIEFETDKGAGVRDPGRQLRAVQKDAVGAPNAATAADYLVVILLVLGFEFVPVHVGQSRHIVSS